MIPDEDWQVVKSHRVVVRHQQHLGHTPLVTLPLWRVGVSTAYLPPIGG
jgi:hypothetical protein